MSLADAEVDIRLMPQNRARYSMQRNMVDGYFAVDRSMELDQIALRSHPVALEKWYWFYIGDMPALDTARIGVIGGSNEAEWLVRNGIEPYLEVASAEQLPALLKRGRIDVALMDHRVMDNLLKTAPQLDDTLKEEFLRYAPLHLYLNRRFSTEHVGVLDEFNASLPMCMKQHLKLSDREREQVARTASRRSISVASALWVAAYTVTLNAPSTPVSRMPKNSVSRWRMGSGPKAGNSGQKTARAFQVPSAAT